jgi:hypothetical protein
VSKQLVTGEVKEARVLIRQDIGHAWDKFMKWDVAMVPLAECMKVEQ